MPIPKDLTPNGPNSNEDQMVADMRARGISEKDIQDTLTAKRTQGPDFELRLAPSKNPTDLTPAGPKAASTPYTRDTYGARAGNALMDMLFAGPRATPQPVPAWLQKMESVGNTMRDYSPDPVTAATMATPGLGLAPALGRTAIATVGRGAEAAAEGRDPLRAGAIAGGIQGATEAIAPGANTLVRFAGQLPMLGGQTRALGRLTNAINNMNKPAAAAPGEYMGKFAPTGIQKGAPLATGGFAPADVAPVTIPHKSLPGWTAQDILNEVAKPPASAQPWTNKMEALFRLLGIGAGAESASQVRATEKP